MGVYIGLFAFALSLKGAIMLKDITSSINRLSHINCGVTVTSPVDTGAMIIRSRGVMQHELRSPRTKSALRGGMIGLAAYRPALTEEGDRDYSGKEVVASSLLVTQALVAKMIRKNILPITWEEIGRITKLAPNVLVETYPRGGAAESISNALFDLSEESRKDVVTPLVATLATQQADDYDTVCARMLVINYVLHRAASSEDMHTILMNRQFGDLIEVALA